MLVAAILTLNGIKINGQILVDGVNSSYGANGFHLDFSDPDDLGADRSGNLNHFSATAQHTAPVAITGSYASTQSTASGGAVGTGTAVPAYWTDIVPADANMSSFGTGNGKYMAAVFNGDFEGSFGLPMKLVLLGFQLIAPMALKVMSVKQSLICEITAAGVTKEKFGAVQIVIRSPRTPSL